MKEIWKDIPEYKNIYQVSNLGQVRSFCGSYLSPIIMKQELNSIGYYRVSLYKDKKYKRYLVHRLVVAAFIGGISKDKVVNHKDANKTNNEINNLEIVTQSDNVKHSYKLGLQDKKGVKHHFAKLTDVKVKEIKINNKKLSSKELGIMYGVSRQTIADVIFGRTWTHIVVPT